MKRTRANADEISYYVCKNWEAGYESLGIPFEACVEQLNLLGPD